MNTCVPSLIFTLHATREIPNGVDLKSEHPTVARLMIYEASLLPNLRCSCTISEGSHFSFAADGDNSISSAGVGEPTPKINTLHHGMEKKKKGLSRNLSLKPHFSIPARQESLSPINENGKEYSFESSRHSNGAHIGDLWW
ncbi:hypothetical protein HNY73_022591 [Argiope bruennichi]|uniref:Uncharacterized protein n=1 Tax=Argiope bruennichi TaxID=94029 RepID=A0A8T0E2W5_ARGBR|nr:hypothetical protein HNY73_022591 [Argiope bruennichi]